MDISVRRYCGVQVIRLRGALKMGVPVTTLSETIEQLADSGDVQVVLNLGEVEVIDSSGVGLLARSLATLTKRRGTLKLVNPSRMALQTLRIVGLLNIFEVFDEENGAVASFGSPLQ